MLKLNRLIWFIGFNAARFVGFATMKVRFVKPAEPVPPPALVVAKHCSYWDVPLVSNAVRRAVPGAYPFFEMGSFHGYPVLEHFIWLLEKLGGFAVMRPKDLIRLKRKTGKEKAELAEIMRTTNEAAAETRREILRRRHALCFFPEGTRSRVGVGKIRSTHEIEDAVALNEAEKVDVVVLPVVPCYGAPPRRRIPFLSRTPVTVKILDPIPLEGRTTEELIAAISAAFVEAWEPAEGP